ncbi:hypothetical protein DV736_g4356, partial [Chaetothyriales sp. CBS 134916]
MSTFKSSLNSPRSSPFRRAASPASPSPARERPGTPPSRTQASPMTSPSKLKHAYTVSEQEGEDEDILNTPTKAPRAHTEPPASPAARQLPTPPMPKAPSHQPSPQRTLSTTFSQGDNLSKLPPQLLHNLRESFAVLDPNSTGVITASSVAETLQSLGLQENNLAQFFPPGQTQQLNLPQYLNQLADILVGLSPEQELLNAFSAFDDDDSGQIEVSELKAGLLGTVPDSAERALTERDIDRATDGFTGRRMLGRQTIDIPGVRSFGIPHKRKTNGDVFRYREFVANLTGGPAIMPQEQESGGLQRSR